MALPVNESFCHQYLQHDHLRVIKLLPYITDGPIRCEVSVVNPEAHPRVQYTCLSYVWGAPEPETEMKTIVLDDQVFKVRRNLWDFVSLAVSTQSFINMGLGGNKCSIRQAFGYDLVGRWLWIDALCIDQNNNDEKSAQVQKMASIFAGASDTLTWLGMDDEHNVDLQSLWKLREHAYWVFRTNTGTKCARGIASLEYWHRAWVVQEQRHSINAHFLWRDFFMEWYDLASLLSCSSNEFPTLAHQMLRDRAGVRSTRLVTMLGRFPQIKCYDSRDRIYALRSCTENGEKIPVDYNMDTESVFDSIMQVLSPERYCLCLSACLIEALELRRHAIGSSTTSSGESPRILVYRNDDTTFGLKDHLARSCDHQFDPEDFPASWLAREGLVICFREECRMSQPRHVFFPAVYHRPGEVENQFPELAYKKGDRVHAVAMPGHYPRVQIRMSPETGRWHLNFCLDLQNLITISEVSKDLLSKDCRENKPFRMLCKQTWSYGSSINLDITKLTSISRVIMDDGCNHEQRPRMFSGYRRRIDHLSREEQDRAVQRQERLFSWLRQIGFEVVPFVGVESLAMRLADRNKSRS